MSAYNEYENIDFTDLSCLIEALGKTSDWATALEVAEGNELCLFGYRGKNRFHETGNNHAEKCTIRIDRKHVGSASNDIGFRKVGSSYIPIISEFDSFKYNDCWMNQLKGQYLENVVKKRAKAQGFTVKKVEQNGKVKMTLTRWV